MRRLRLPILAASLTAVLTAGLVSAPGTASASGPGATCTKHSVSVGLTDGGPLDQTVVGVLCLPRFGTPETVQLLVHGATYNKAYWDFPQQPYLYSYTKYANLAGYATFSVDIVGSGESSRPHSSQLNHYTVAKAMNDVITKLRAGAIGPIAFDKVIWVGHSMGTITGWASISAYDNVDGFIATGAPHALSTAGSGAMIPFPASLDPKFAAMGLDDGYLSVSEESRNFYYHLPMSDPQVRALDYATRDTLATPYFLTALDLLAQPAHSAVTRNITAPVLSIFGEYDSLFCAPDALDCSDYAAVQQHEAPYYPNASDFDLVIVPQTGHDLNTHYTAPLSYAAMIAWALTHVAP